MLPYATNAPTPGNQLDQQVNPEWMRVCKSMLPYLDRHTQKNLAISLKMLELVTVIQLYSKDNEIDPIPMSRSSNWEQDLLLDIKSSLSPEKSYMIDAIMKLGEFKNLLSQNDRSSLDHLQTTQMPFESEQTPPPPPPSPKSSNSGPEDILDKLSPLLDDKQRQMLKMFSALMGSNQ
ncbi:MAG: hypothetical protein ACRCW2_09910 [Cellulosilyticaceae bacterium]